MQAQKRKPVVQGVDEFLNHSTRAGGGAYLSSWKKDGSGSILVWLHSQLFSAPCWNHPVPHVVEVKDGDDKKLIVMPQRWVCHEVEELLKRQFFYDKENPLERETPPLLCPQCLVNEEVRRLHLSGKIKWTDPVFEWKGTEDTFVIHAGGIDGFFGKKDLSREQLKELKRADIRRDEAYKENLRAKLNYLFCVVDDGDVESGIQKTFEARALGEKLKKAIKDEIKRARTRADPEGRNGNPTVKPYPIEWSYDEDKDFDEKYDVLCKTNEEATEQVLKLIQGPPPDVSKDLEPGNCFSLRVELEEHCVLPKGLLNFDKCFEAAAAAGLMVPPEESKEDQDEDLGAETDGASRTYEVQGEKKKAEPSVYRVDEKSPAWSDKKWRAPSAVKGADVVLYPPDDVADEVFKAVKQACKEAGAASVAEAVTCTHCSAEMTTLDADCPHCGAEYDDDGNLTTRPCLAPECGAQVPLEKDATRFICQKCAAIHEGTDQASWRLVEKEEKAKEDKPRDARRRNSGAAPAAPKEGDDRKRGVPFDQPQDAAPRARR